MKAVKIKAKYLKDLAFMYKDLGLVENNETDPSRVLVSKADAKLMKKNIMLLAKKQKPYLNDKQLKSVVAFEWLNLGPCEIASDAVKEGYLIIL